MGYDSLESCTRDLERHGHLVRVHEEVDPYLEMAAIHMRVFERGGPAILFENVKGSPFRAVSNLFGTMDRSRFIFRDTLERVKALVALKYDPLLAARHPLRHLPALRTATSALPRRTRRAPVRFGTTRISELPQIVNWPRDGGPFITLPQVYSEDVNAPGVMNANLGMYRIQMGGNEYVSDREVGLHYQIHRGIGVHQARANAAGLPLPVSVFVGGPPAHTLAAVMPLPEGLPEDFHMPLLGDLVICAPVVAREARQQGKSPAAHYAHLTVHGVLHLLGCDHEDEREAEAMERLEREILDSLGFADPYLDA